MTRVEPIFSDEPKQRIEVPFMCREPQSTFSGSTFSVCHKKQGKQYLMEQNSFFIGSSTCAYAVLWTVTTEMAKTSKTDCFPDKKAEDKHCFETARIITVINKDERNIL